LLTRLTEKPAIIRNVLILRPVYGQLKKQFGDLGRVVDISIAVQTP
jgi:hypothetical protein